MSIREALRLVALLCIGMAGGGLAIGLFLLALMGCFWVLFWMAGEA